MLLRKCFEKTRDVPITKSLNKANFIIVNSIISTVFLECLANNIPCFVISLFDEKCSVRNTLKIFMH